MKALVALVVVFLITLVIIDVTVARSATNATRTSYSWASWYGPGLYGNLLGCGGRLYTNTWGVANKTLRCGTSLTICYRRCVKARVIDRGPYVWGRDFDLTYPVKTAIGMPGVGKVRWWVNK